MILKEAFHKWDDEESKERGNPNVNSRRNWINGINVQKLDRHNLLKNPTKTLSLVLG